MSNKKATVEEDARARAGQTLADGKPIMDRGLLLRCAQEIERLKEALRDVVTNAPNRGGIWAKQRASDALEQES